MQGYLRYYLAKIFLGSLNCLAPWGETADTHLVFKLGYTKITLRKSLTKVGDFLTLSDLSRALSREVEGFAMIF